MESIFNINSISMFHQLLGYEKPKHPLITLVDLGKINSAEQYLNQKYVTDFYIISLKNCSDCSLKYGRRYYDFSEGSLMFVSPRQIAVVENISDDMKGWMLCFHPDLIAGTSLSGKMEEYSFFSYDANEALHVSDSEKGIIENIVRTIELEFSQNIDIYSKELIVSNLEVLLNYAKRFYGRQFITREKENMDTNFKFNNLLKESFEKSNLDEYGIPTVKQLSGKMGYSCNYLSDLLKKETGKSTQEHIQLFLLEKAKDMLLGTNETISSISYALGFSYPAHFSKFFKLKTGMSPVEYRKKAQ